jgi:hypothetical protein
MAVEGRVDSPLLLGFWEADLDDQTLEEALDHLVPSHCEEGEYIPMDTYLGNSAIHPSITSIVSKNSGAKPKGIDTNYSWSIGLGFETSPIKMRSARKKKYLKHDSYEVDTTSTGSHTGELRGLKSLVRDKI